MRNAKTKKKAAYLSSMELFTGRGFVKYFVDFLANCFDTLQFTPNLHVEFRSKLEGEKELFRIQLLIVGSLENIESNIQ